MVIYTSPSQCSDMAALPTVVQRQLWPRTLLVKAFFFLLCAFSLLFFHESLVKNTYNGFLSFSGISPSVPLSVIANNVANQIKLH